MDSCQAYVPCPPRLPGSRLIMNIISLHHNAGPSLSEGAASRFLTVPAALDAGRLAPRLEGAHILGSNATKRHVPHVVQTTVRVVLAVLAAHGVA